jgi:hypothetical protein
LKYFFDNDLSYRFAKMLSALDVDAVALRDELPQHTKDVDLLSALAGRDIVLVSGDRIMTRRPAELKALRSAGVIALFFGPFWSNMTFWRQAEWLVRRWQTIDGFASGAAKGTFAEIKQNGKSEIIPP